MISRKNHLINLSFISGDRDVCTVYVAPLHDRVMAVGSGSLQIIGVRQGYFDRCLSFHSDRVISREVSCQTQLWPRKLLFQG